MRKALIVAPNIGLHMGKGGGVRVAVAMAKVLQGAGFKPYLVANRGYNVERLSQLHGINLQRTKALYYLGFGESARIPFPLQVKMITSFVERLICKYHPEVVVFHDDIPLIDEKIFKETNVILYSHFPYAARIKFNVTDVYEIPPIKRSKILEEVYRKALRKLIYVDSVPEPVTLIANSTVTAAFMRRLWNKNVRIVYPPFIKPEYCDEYKTTERRKNIVVALATLQPNKRIGDVIKALSLLKNVNAKLIIVGHKGDKRYIDYLENLICSLGVQDRVTLMIDVDECTKWHILAKTKAIISTAHFEPFGIAVVEGMYTGAIPIVYKGALSGPWIDIIKQGKYGLGFKAPVELAKDIETVVEDFGTLSYTFYPVRRAEKFTYEEFSKKLKHLIC